MLRDDQDLLRDERALEPTKEDGRLGDLYACATPRQREILDFRRQNPDSTHGDVARALSLATGTVRVQWHRLITTVRAAV